MSQKICFKIIYLLILFIPIFSTEIINLDEDNFDKEIYSSKEIWLIEIYSEKCESCASFAPKWKQLTKKMNYLNMGRINIDEQKGMSVAKKLNALQNGIPAIKLIISKDDIVDIMTGVEEPFPNSLTLKKRIDKILEEKGKLQEAKSRVSEEL